MTPECIFFDCDGTLVDSERLCTIAYVTEFLKHGIHCDAEDIYTRFKGARLYDIIETVAGESGKSVPVDAFEKGYRAEVKSLFDSELQAIEGASSLIDRIALPMCVVSNGTVDKMRHSLGLTGMLSAFGKNLFSGYDARSWKPDPALLKYASEKMNVELKKCILIDDSSAGVQAGISAGIPVFYFRSDESAAVIRHPLVHEFTSMRDLPGIWQSMGWHLTHP